MSKPVLKTKVVTIEFWSCGHPDHQHKTESTAQACIDRTTNAEKQKSHYVWSDSALARLLAEFRSGEKKAAIARRYGLSATQIAQRIHQAERIELKRALPINEQDPFDSLPTATRNALFSANIHSISDIKRYEQGGSRLSKIPNLGPKGLRLIAELIEAEARLNPPTT